MLNYILSFFLPIHLPYFFIYHTASSKSTYCDVASCLDIFFIVIIIAITIIIIIIIIMTFFFTLPGHALSWCFVCFLFSLIRYKVLLVTFPVCYR